MKDINIKKTNPHEGHRKRLKQRFLNEGLDHFEIHQILELYLFYVIPQGDTNEIAHNLYKTFGSLSCIFNASATELMKVKGVGEHAAVLFTLLNPLMSKINIDKMGQKVIMDSTSRAGKYALNLLSHRIYETFYVIFLNANKKVLNAEIICEGTIDEVSAYPRLIVESVLKNKAQKVILAHNHPGGRLIPSAQDIEATHSIIYALKLIDVEVIDHIIVGNGEFISLVEKGVIKK